MTKSRGDLPQLSGDLFLTEGGIETTLIFHVGIDLPEFAAFDLLKDEAGIVALSRYFRTYAALAKKYWVGFIFESPTWRASTDTGMKLGYSNLDLAEKNKQAITLLDKLRSEFEDEEGIKMLISGCIGPRDDGYNPSAFMDVQQAEDYHCDQIETFS